MKRFSLSQLNIDTLITKENTIAASAGLSLTPYINLVYGEDE